MKRYIVEVIKYYDWEDNEEDDYPDPFREDIYINNELDISDKYINIGPGYVEGLLKGLSYSGNCELITKKVFVELELYEIDDL